MKIKPDKQGDARNKAADIVWPTLLIVALCRLLAHREFP